MKLYLDLDENGYIKRHYWDKYQDIDPMPKPIEEMFYSKLSPESLFSSNDYGYKYKVVNGEFVEINGDEFENQPIKKLKKIHEKLNDLKEKEKKKKDKSEWQEVKKLLTDADEINECDKIIENLGV